MQPVTYRLAPSHPALDVHLRAHAAADRLEEVLEEVGTVRAEAGWLLLAAPIGQILASQALLHVLEARRYGTVIDEFRALVQGVYGKTPEPVYATVERAVGLLAPRAIADEDPLTAEATRARQRSASLRARRSWSSSPCSAPMRRSSCAWCARAALARDVADRRGRGRRAGRAYSRAREDRPGERSRGDRDRGRGNARVGAAGRRGLYK